MGVIILARPANYQSDTMGLPVPEESGSQELDFKSDFVFLFSIRSHAYIVLQADFLG
jgi:hypothetical protein